MGKWSEYNCEKELMQKMRKLFDEVKEKIHKEHPEAQVSFEEFVLCFDEKDKMMKKLFECMVKETLSNIGSSSSSSPHHSEPSLLSSNHPRTATLLLTTAPLSSMLSGGTLTLIPATLVAHPQSSRDANN